MIKLHIIVEGQTEETFVREILYEHLMMYGIHTRWHVIRNAVRRGKSYRGGVGNHTYMKLKRDILRSQRGDTWVTTMFDLYALPLTFPGAEQALMANEPYEKAKIIEKKMKEDIKRDLFIPFITVHEFEALLFSDIKCIDRIMRLHCPSRIKELEQIDETYKNPEYINGNPETAPSKRLKHLYPSYQKITDGILIAKCVELENMRKRCVHFDKWVSSLEMIRKKRKYLDY